MSSLRGVIFDIDGTLVNSNDAHARSWVLALKEGGYSASFEDVRKLIGKGGDKILPELTGVEKDSREGETISRRRAEIFKEQFLPSLKPFPGARDLLAHLRQRGLRLVVASSAQKEELDELLRIADITDLIEDRTSSSDAARSKPDPDIVKAALDNMGLRPKNVFMIGDTPYDIEAAEGAGIRTIAFRSGGRSDADLQGAIAIYNGPADLLARYDASPLAAGRGSAHAEAP